MDGDRFDDITRRLAADTSRRSFLKRSAVAVAALTGLSRATGTSAARRPTPTPPPVSCPGRQIPSGATCVCPSGLTKCSAECCPASAQCCDGACCYGTCYGEELCCPTGQIVCEGRCLDPGRCCTNADCQPGWACGIEIPHVCTCVPTVTCASSGRNCGPLFDDCGHTLDCGTCQSPETCGGGATPGVCGCTVTTSCDDKCGVVSSNCGTTVDCGPCTSPDTCGGSGIPNVCGCTVTTSCDGKCGVLSTNCGTTLDCGSCSGPETCGGGRTPNICGCTVTTTCNGKCGNLTTNCGTTLACGGCQAPETCGGGGIPNVCGCSVTTTCGDQCGQVATNCDTTLDCGECEETDPCGNTCGQCQVCSGTTCVTADDGTHCGADCTTGVCFQGVCSFTHTIECPGSAGTGTQDPDEVCNSYQCVQTADSVDCVKSAANDGRSCEPLDACQTGVCSQGKCIGEPLDCGTCMSCREGTCESNSGDTCGPEHKCVDGTCSHFPTGDPPDGVNVQAICSDLKCENACCPGPGLSTCCASMDDCFLYDAGGFLNAYCCDPADKCAGDCCWSGNSCAGGTGCRPDTMICADNPYCTEACCGGGNPGTGTCCPSGQRCQNGVCTAEPTGSCNGDADCPTGSTCAGYVRNLQTGETIQAGTCCLTAFTYINPSASTTAGQTVYGCCGAPEYPGYPDVGANCCTYADVVCAGCQCSRTSVRRWGN